MAGRAGACAVAGVRHVRAEDAGVRGADADARGGLRRRVRAGEYARRDVQLPIARAAAGAPARAAKRTP